MQALPVAALLVAALSVEAEAGACLDDTEIEAAIGLLEKRVTKADVDMDYLGMCLPAAIRGDFKTTKRIARINAACTKILGKAPSDAQCTMLAGYQGTAELAGVDIFDAVAAWNSGPWSATPGGAWITDLDLFVKLADARAVPLVVERWKTFEAEAAKRESRKRGKAEAMMAWATWRRQAAAVLGALGGEAEATFLDAQAKATKDRFVRQACLGAAKAIRARVP